MILPRSQSRFPLTLRCDGAERVRPQSPQSENATRQFCISAREKVFHTLELKAPGDEVLRFNPRADRTSDRRVIRRCRLGYLLARQEVRIEKPGSFADADIENVMELLRRVNEDTHGTARTYSVQQLQTVRQRIENAPQFVSQIAGQDQQLRSVARSGLGSLFEVEMPAELAAVLRSFFVNTSAFTWSESRRRDRFRVEC